MAERLERAYYTLICRYTTAGFSTLHITQVAGLHRAVPSTTLDKAMKFNNRIISDFPGLSTKFDWKTQENQPGQERDHLAMR